MVVAMARIGPVADWQLSGARTSKADIIAERQKRAFIQSSSYRHRHAACLLFHRKEPIAFNAQTVERNQVNERKGGHQEGGNDPERQADRDGDRVNQRRASWAPKMPNARNGASTWRPSAVNA
jgi:hypothetical protein